MPRKKAGWNAYMFWAVLGVWLSTSLYAADKIYKSTDEYGVPIYSNTPPEPGAQALDMPELSVIPPPEFGDAPMRDPMRPALELAENTSQEETERNVGGNNYNLNIVKPAHNETVPITGSIVEVELNLKPKLDVAAGHRIEIVVDGVVSKETRETRVSLPGLDRGSHQVMARILNDRDEVVQTTKTVTFFAQQAVVFPDSAGG